MNVCVNVWKRERAEKVNSCRLLCETIIVLIPSNRVKSLVVAFKLAIVILVIRSYLYTHISRMGKEGGKGNVNLSVVIIGAHFLLPS